MARLFTKEQHEYFLATQEGRTAKEVARRMNDRFELHITPSQVRSYRQNHNIKSGLTGRFPKGHVPFNKGKKFPDMPPNSGQFKKGNKPPNYVPIGTIRYTTDGYPRRKIANPDKWELCHHAEWIKHNGPIPEGYSIAFLDGDKTNWNIDNLVCLDRGELAQMNRKKLFASNPELTKAGIGVVKIKRKLSELKNEK